jgi:histidine triad (HIT) family protein
MTTYATGEASEEGCLFCRIIRGVVPSDPVLATEHTYAFRDIQPAAPIHVLVVPKRHIGHAGMVEVDDGPLLAEVLGAARQVAEQEGIGERGYRLVFNVGEDAQNSVPHLHLHVLGGRRLGWPPG